MKCHHCLRTIILDGDIWVDPEASGDDAIWRETCDAHDTFTAEHEPSTAVEFYQFQDGTEFYECGCCGQCHPTAWNGDCRDDASRFTLQQLEAAHGDALVIGHGDCDE